MVDETKNHEDASNAPKIPGDTLGAPATELTPEKARGAPVSVPAPLSAEAPESARMGADIAKILKEVKLPERRTSGASDLHPKQIEVKNFDTVLGSDVKAGIEMEKTEAAEARGPVRTEEPKSSVVAMHTLKQDLQGVVHDKNISVVRAASLEQSRRRPEPIDEPAAPRKSRLMTGLLVAAVLLLLGGAALFGVYFVGTQSAAPLPQQQGDSLVFAEQSVPFSISGQTSAALKTQLAQARLSSNASLGSITRITPTFSTAAADGSTATRAVPFSEFLNAIGARAPDSLLRALSDTYFLGIHAVDENAPVIVIPITSYDRAFAGMLEWERTINANLSPLFTALPVLTTDTNGLPTERVFSDIVMRNYDVRALKDDAGAIQMYYSFPTRDMLIIGESPYTFAEILSRLQAGRKL